METVQAQLRAYYLDVQRAFDSENHSRYAAMELFPWNVAALCLDGGALSVRSKNETDSV